LPFGREEGLGDGYGEALKVLVQVSGVIVGDLEPRVDLFDVDVLELLFHRVIEQFIDVFGFLVSLRPKRRLGALAVEELGIVDDHLDRLVAVLAKQGGDGLGNPGCNA